MNCEHHQHAPCTIQQNPGQLYVAKSQKVKDDRVPRMVSMMCLNFAYMLCELIVGIIGNSLTLVGDSFHMLSDSLSLIIGFTSIKLGRRQNNTVFTFGYKRSEILGAFFNASFLISVAFFMLTEIIQKFLEPEEMREIDLVLYTAIGGIVINFIGMFLFHEHGDGEDGHHHHHHCCGGHHHHDDDEEGCDHDHDHCDHSHSHDHKCDHHHDHKHDDHSHSHDQEHEHNYEHHDHGHDHTHGHAHSFSKKKGGDKKQKDMATHGVFLHVMGDFIGSIIAILSALVQKLAPDWKYKVYVDPTTSTIMVIILLCAAVPLLKKAIKVLMQTTTVNREAIMQKLLEIKGVDGIHDLHIWQYVPGREVAHCHIVSKLSEPKHIETAYYQELNRQIQNVFHEYGVHNVTVNIEFVSNDEKDLDACFTSEICGRQNAWCCKNYPRKINMLENPCNISRGSADEGTQLLITKDD